MKKILMLLLCCSIYFTNSATNVSGLILTNTTWTKVNSPYIVNGNLMIDSGVILTIQPGVEVRIDSTYFFHVNGRLIADGTVTDTIKFTSNKSAPSKKAWSGITFGLQSIDTSKMNYCLFEYGHTPIRTTGAKMKITNSVFRHNTTAIYINSVPGYPYTDFILINKCLITQNDTGMYDAGTYSIESKVTENVVSLNNIGFREENSRGLRNFNYNEFNYNAIGYSATGGQFGSRLNNFKGNTIYGVYVAAATPKNIGYISEGHFMYNATAIYLNNANGGAVYGNTIAFNGIGIDDNYSYTPATSRTLVYFNYNCYNNNTFYNFKENGRFDIISQNDWWGTTSTPGIDSTIYDFYDNSTKGKVAYTPIQTTTSGCKPTTPPPPCNQTTSVTMTPTSPTTATVSWPAAAGAIAYEYFVTKYPSTPPSSGSITSSTSLNLTNLIPGQTYSVCVRTKCAASPFLSAWVCDTVTMATCNTPANLTVKHVITNKALVVWDTVAGVTAYEYYVLPHPSTTPSSATATTSHAIIVSGLSANTTYDVCVRSKCVNIYSAWSCDTFRTTTGTGIPTEYLENAVRIYPNPSNGTFNVSLENGLYENTVMTVYDITGRMITSKQMNTANETISIGNAAKGVYTIRVVTDNNVVNKRIVIE